MMKPTRVSWPRSAPGNGGAMSALPALVTAVPARPYVGRSRFVLSPLSLTLDQLLLLITAALLCFGILMTQSADARIRGGGVAGGVSVGSMMDSLNMKNIIHAGMAICAMVAVSRFNYRRMIGGSLISSPAVWLVALTVLALVAVFVPGLGKEVNGARRWVGVGPIQLQPSELAKLGLVTFIAAYAVHCQEQIRSFGLCVLPLILTAVGLGVMVVKPEWAAKVHAFSGESGAMKFRIAQAAVAIGALVLAAFMWRTKWVRAWTWGFLPLVCVFGVVAALVIKEDFGTAALVSVVSFIMMAMAGCRWWHLAMLIPPGALVVWASIFRDHESFRYKRFMAFLNPWADPKGVGYHPIQSLLAIASGGQHGLGLGNGIQKMGFLPEDNTDFIFSIICEELGFVGAFLVIGLFIAFVIVGWRIASRCNDLFGKMVAFGITAIIGLQAAFNIAVVTVTMPTKGIALPLISSGGTGWIMNAAAIGLLMSIERVNRREIEGRRSRPAEPALGFPVQVVAAAPVTAVRVTAVEAS